MKKGGGKTMKVRMLKDVKDVGKKGEIVMVNPAFAANCLLPQKYALNLNSELGRTTHEQLVHDKEEADAKYKAEVDAAAEIRTKILDGFEDGITLTLKTKSANSDALFHPLHARDITQKMERVLRFKIDPKLIHVPKMKKIGTGWVTFDLHKEVTCEVKLKTVRG
jgi:large subunit ribosomal protein L9